MRYIFRLPDVGEGIHEAEIVSYEVKVGDMVKADQTIIKIETDKAVVTLPAPAEGKVLEIPHNPGDTVSAGDPIIILETEKVIEEVVVEAEIPAAIPVEAATPPVEIKREKVFEEKPAAPRRVLATPHTRHLARELGVDISTVKGTGSRGRITDDDVRRTIKEAPAPPPKIPRAAAVSHEPSTLGFDFEKYGQTRREPLKGVRKRIAEVMVRSYSTIPHVTHADEVDVTDLFEVLKRQKTTAEQRGIKLTITAFITKAVVSALQAFPEVNTSLDEESGEIVFKDYYHIGIATDTEQGLMVPVVKDADKKSILQIAKDIQDLAAKARNREIDLEDLWGGTFSITNPGGIGGIHATPIIQHLQVAILGVLAARKKLVVKNDQIVIRSMMPLVVSFDHRLLDGATMARFMNHVVDLLSDPMKMLVDVV
jgi:pyruvate/2-oxoglutarate dehydrogenase complex dihydrolipoamide acyltransferase (E2) component